MKRTSILVASTILLLLLVYVLLTRTGPNLTSPPMALALVPDYPSTVPLIDLTNSGFTPSDSTITAGMSVTFRNSTNTHHMLIGDGFLRETSTLFLPLIGKSGAALAEANASTQNSGQQVGAGTGQANEPLVNTCQFQVPMPPASEYIHEYTNAGECHVYLTTAVHTANIAVNSAYGPASLTGRVLDTTNAVQGNERPVVVPPASPFFSAIVSQGEAARRESSSLRPWPYRAAPPLQDVMQETAVCPHTSPLKGQAANERGTAVGSVVALCTSY